MNDMTSARPSKQRYSRKQAPATEDEALEAMGDIELQIAGIETQLRHKRPEDFSTVEGHDRWRNAAITALGHYENELRCLEKWMLGRGYRGFSPRVVEIIDEVKARIDAMHARLLPICRPRYTASAPPADHLAARHRLDQLGELRNEINLALGQAAAELEEVPDFMGKSQLKRPLYELNVVMGEEIPFLKRLIRQMDDGFNDFRNVCLGALMRAISQGFELTTHESEALAFVTKRLPALLKRD